MLLDLRETVRNSKPIKYTLITLICIPFALVGIGSYFSGGQIASVAEVNGVEINAQQLDSAYSQQRQRMAQMFGGQIPEALANEELLRQQALDQLISRQVMRSEVEEHGFAIGDATLNRAIRSMPAFQVEGRFDSASYQSQLGAAGMNVAAFEQQLRDDSAMNQFRSGVAETNFLLPQEKARIDALTNQTRTIDFMTLDLAAVKETIEVSDDDASTYFTDNADSFVFPQRAKLQYIHLDAESLAEAIDVTDDEALARYEENRSLYISPEVRSASHILLNLEDDGDADEIAEKTATLNELKARIEAGEAFADLAREFSEDVGSAEQGGSLGNITPGAMVPEFEVAVFAIGETGGISNPVKSDFGVHLIQLDGITPESGKPFEEVKDEVIGNMRQNQADSEFFELREKLSEFAFDSPDSLDSASDETGLEVISTDWLDVDTVDGPVLSNPQILATAFSDEVLIDGNNSDLVELTDRSVVTLRVLEHEEPRPKTLDDVREEVIDTVKTERAAELLDTTTEEILAELNAGGTVSVLAEGQDNAEATSAEELTRQSTTLDRNVVSDIYALAKPADGKPVNGSGVLANGNRIVYSLIAVATPEPAVDDEEQNTQENFGQRLGGTEFNALLQSLRTRADVETFSYDNAPVGY